MDRTAEVENWQAELRRHGDRLKKCLTMAEGAAGVEKAYAIAYQNLVRLGAAPQLRKKYRG